MILERHLAFRFPLPRGEDVRRAQLALQRAGHLRGEADGVFGPVTREAVLAFQRAQGLPADGIVGPATWGRMQASPSLLPDSGWREALAPLLPRLTAWHGPPVGSGTHRWRLTRDGVQLDGEAAPRRSPRPDTAAACWTRHRAALEAAAARYEVPVELLLATACAESGGRAGAVREEPGFVSDAATPHRVSPGLMQTLISTAREALEDPSLDREALLDPAVSALAAAAFIRRQALRARLPTGFDPPLVAISYNAGSLRPSRDGTDPWGMVQTRRGNGTWHADAFCGFLGDAMGLVEGTSAPSLRAALGDLAPER